MFRCAFVIIVLTLCCGASSLAQVHDPRAIEADPHTATGPIAPVLAGLGDQSITVTTANERSQYFFNQGFRLTLGFNHSEALRSFKEAVRLEDTLLYNEPPDWYFPVRHVLGAILLEAGLAAEAEIVYWEDLRRNPNNGFSLFGLMQALRAQGNADTAPVIKARFDAAWSAADVTLTNSRF